MLERVGALRLQGLEGPELLALLDVSPVEKPYARHMEGPHPVGKARVPGYQLLTCLLLDGQGHLGLRCGRLLAYGEEGMRGLPMTGEGACCPEEAGGGDAGAGPLPVGGEAGEGPRRELLLWLGGKLRLKGEWDGHYLLMRGLLRLLNYEVAHDALVKSHFSCRFAGASPPSVSSV